MLQKFLKVHIPKSYLIVSLLMIAIAFVWLQWDIEKRKNLRASVEEHKVKRLAFWRSRKGSVLDSLAQPQHPPQAVLDYVNLDNQYMGWTNRARKLEITEDLKNAWQKTLERLPGDLRDELQDVLVGVFVAKDFGGSGYTEYVYDSEGKPSKAFTLIDPTRLMKPINQWARERELTALDLTDSQRLETELASRPEDNTFAASLRYILIHEMAHVISVGHPVHPRFDRVTEGKNLPENFEFSKLSWKSENDIVKTRFEDMFPFQKSLGFYGFTSKKIPADQVVQLYQTLSQTNFPSLYAALSPAEDFAESMALYFHERIFGQQYRIKVFEGEELAFEFTSCLSRGTCPEKVKIFEEIFGLQ